MWLGLPPRLAGDGMREYSEEYVILCQKIQVWEEDYVEEHTKGKTDAQLETEGWWRTNFGNWTCMELGEARHKKFKKEFDQLLLTRIYQASDEKCTPCKWNL